MIVWYIYIYKFVFICHLPIGFTSCKAILEHFERCKMKWVSGQLRDSGWRFPHLMNPDDWQHILGHLGISKLRLSDAVFFDSQRGPENSARNWTRSSFSRSGLCGIFTILYQIKWSKWRRRNLSLAWSLNQPGGWINTIIKAVRLDDNGKVVAYEPRQHFAPKLGGDLQAGGGTRKRW